MNSLAKTILNFSATILDALIWICVLIFFTWAFGALYYFALVPPIVGAILAFAYLLVILACCWKVKNKRIGRSKIVVSVIVVYLTTLMIRPSNERIWDADQALVAQIEIGNGDVKIHNFRNNVYRSNSDYDVHFQTKQFQLTDISSVWFIVQKFTAGEAVAHVFVSFGLTSTDTFAKRCFERIAGGFVLPRRCCFDQ